MNNETENIRHSLTAPIDQNNDEATSFQLGTVLTEDEVKSAVNELAVHSFVDKFPRVEKFYADAPIPNQTYALISFTPARGARPDSDGVFGMIKVRGTFSNQMEADNYAERLIRSDSYHPIYYTYVGKPFPLSKNGKYISETKEIDIKKKITEETSKNIRSQRDDDDNTIKELKEREEALLSDCKEDKEYDPVDRYTELAVKRAQLKFTYVEQAKKMVEIKQLVKNAEKEINELNEKYPDCRDRYYDVYRNARKKANLPWDDQSFIKYMGDDLQLDLEDVKY